MVAFVNLLLKKTVVVVW